MWCYTQDTVARELELLLTVPGHADRSHVTYELPSDWRLEVRRIGNQLEKLLSSRYRAPERLFVPELLHGEARRWLLAIRKFQPCLPHPLKLQFRPEELHTDRAALEFDERLI
jgi:hypothetical protein